MSTTASDTSAAAPQVEQRMAVMSLKEDPLSHPASAYALSSRVPIATVLAAGRQTAGQEVVVGGWVRTGRVQGKGAFAFVQLNDGSCQDTLQCMIDSSVSDLQQVTQTGACLLLRGNLKETPEGTKQEVELSVKEILHLGPCDPKTYPVAKTRLTLEYLRSVIHLRTRTSTIGAVTRIRNCLARATHRFFQERGFLYVNTPLITASDCEGAGEMFQVTTLLSQAEENVKTAMPTEEELKAAQAAVEEQGQLVREMKEAKKDKRKVKAAVEELQARKAKVDEFQMKLRSPGGLPRTEDGTIDYSQDFFARPSFLTVSGQLEAEIYACSLTNVYTFGPTFRAENSHTNRHLAEFWMIEPELAFCDIDGLMQCASDYVRFCCKAVLEECPAELDQLQQRIDKSVRERLEFTAHTPVKRVSYTDACEVLQEHVREGKVKFEEDVEWGIDLRTEHERYLCEQVFKAPVIVYNYPKGIKAFYMRLNDDDKTVAAMDLLVPKVGELIGGSQREERYDILERRVGEAGLDRDSYDWYLALRKYGSVPHSGFGLGFERLILFSTGIENIRDVIPFPRYPGHIL